MDSEHTTGLRTEDDVPRGQLTELRARAVAGRRPPASAYVPIVIRVCHTGRAELSAVRGMCVCRVWGEMPRNIHKNAILIYYSMLLIGRDTVTCG